MTIRELEIKRLKESILDSKKRLRQLGVDIH
jgi:DNA-binding CsgD family transcriptional regulator